MEKKHKKYDCIVVGSGPGGAPFAWSLASKGMDVLILEAGIKYDPYKDYALNQDDWELKGFPYKYKNRYVYGNEQSLEEQYQSLESWYKIEEPSLTWSKSTSPSLS